MLHQVGHRPTVAHSLEDLCSDESHRLGVIELEAALLPSARHIGGSEDQGFSISRGVRCMATSP